MKNKEYKKELKQIHIDNLVNFGDSLQNFLDENPNIKIISTIVHKPFNITIIYEKLTEIV